MKQQATKPYRCQKKLSSALLRVRLPRLSACVSSQTQRLFGLRADVRGIKSPEEGRYCSSQQQRQQQQAQQSLHSRGFHRVLCCVQNVPNSLSHPVSTPRDSLQSALPRLVSWLRLGSSPTSSRCAQARGKTGLSCACPGCPATNCCV